MYAPTQPNFPQEIIDLIIDFVASETDSQRKRLEALRACCLVSMAFNTRSKQHIFSEINFHADDFAQKRAQKLLRVLDLPANRDLLQYIRTTRPATGIGERAGAILTGLGRTLKATKRNLLILLARMTSAPVEVLIVETRNGLLDFKRISDDFRSLLLAIRSQSNLKSLHFINVTNLDKTFVVSNVSPTGLQELGLWNVAFTDSPVNGSLVPLPFQNLISLAVSFPEAVVVIPFCRTLESLDSMIETLEIRKCPIGPCKSCQELETAVDILSHLSNLRSLKLSTTGSPQNFSYIAPHHMAYLLTLGARPRLGRDAQSQEGYFKVENRVDTYSYGALELLPNLVDVDEVSEFM
ncbi:hypothetical protein CPB84DRAFT_1783416 [Gymnopilus junonius]|uniref:Uncharacterized protein n=1 Tax=Gymnopilus junonius TaxID=109634 RepID=A0A9P5NKK2_GYMJU|nr:hypothetical protein CPB84DRAFT_1783416 [Gymnopilus junonius]